MSFNRNIAADQQNTKNLIGKNYIPSGKSNWLGHRNNAGTAHIDRLLLNGATLQQLGGKRGAINEHLNHLRTVHGLHIIENNGIFKFV